MSRIRLMNIMIDNLTMKEALERICELIKENRCAFIVTPNVDHLVQIEKGGILREAYNEADLILPDGKPLIWISKVYGTPLKEKISGSDLLPELCECASKKKLKMYFLGAREGVASRAADNLTRRFPGLNVVGNYSPPYGFENSDKEMEKIKRQIKSVRPDILVVCLGCPKQEIFMYENRKELGVPVSLGLGASLDFESGIVKRAPQWMSRHGLEWLYRLLKEPRRMVRRYLIDDMMIFRMIVKYRKQQ